MDRSTEKQQGILSILARTNFLCAFNPAFFCTFTALLLFQRGLLFEKLSIDMLFIYAVYALPLLFTGVPEHYLTTRYSCRNVVTFSRFFETLTGLLACFALTLPAEVCRFPLLLTVILMGIEYAMYRPALKGYTAEKVPRSLLSWASAATESTTFFGIAFGAISAIAVFHIDVQFGGPFWSTGLFSLATACYSLVLSTRMDPDLAQRHNLKFSELPRQWLDTLRKQPRYRELVITGIGESFIFGLMIFVSAMIVQYASAYLSGHAEGQLHVYLILPSAALGCAFGCLLGGWLSKSNVELGLVPPSVLAMTLISLMVGGLPYYSDFVLESGFLAGLLFLFGIFAGIMLVPVQAYQEYFVRKSLRPAFFSWFYLPFGLGILLAIGLSCLMYFYEIRIYSATLSIALFTALIAVFSFAVMPQFLLRMLMKLLLCTLYRLRIFYKERMPEEGPALIVANRSSFVDIFFLSATTTRPIRFMMHESYFRNPLLRPFYAAAGFLEVTPTKPKRLQQLFEKTRNALAKGELVCIFPEGEITRNGTMSEFKDGMEMMLPEGMDVPVIPVRIGMTWGSIFSCYMGKFRLRWPNELPHPASVTIGEPMPRTSSAYELRIKLTELAAETEMTATPEERPFHAQFAFIAKRFPLRHTVSEFSAKGPSSPCNIGVLVMAILLSRKLRRLQQENDPDYIGIMLPNGIAAFLALIGIMMADKCPAVLNYTASKEAFHHSIQKTGLRIILTSRLFLQKLGMEALPQMIFMEDIIPEISRPSSKIFWLVLSCVLTARELMRLVSPASWKDVNRLAVILFSSGSTGLPKGIMLTHHNINADSTAFIKLIGWNRNDRILGNLPIFHSFGLNVCLWLPVITGAETVLMPNPLDSTLAGRALREKMITVLMATPAFLLTYMRRCPKEAFKTLRFVVSGAEKLRDDIADRFFNLTGLVIAEGYGCTELSPVVSVNLANSLMELGTTVAKRGSIGPPIPGVCVKIVDPASFRMLPEDTDGLLIVKGALVMQGYLGDPEKTAEVIRDGWYITGDIAHMDKNGFITLTGRLSRFSKIAGEMVPHELVEREINNILQPEERILAVCGAEDPKRGEKLIVFYCDEEKIRPQELVRLLREKGIPNLWIPKAENFVKIDSLPVLGSGKLDLSRLAQMAQDIVNDRKDPSAD